MKHIFVILILCALVLRTSACSCGEKPTTVEAVARSAIVFSGVLTKLEVINRPEPKPDGNISHYGAILVCVFTEVEAFKGAANAKKEVTVMTPFGFAACRYPFEIGLPYLVYASVDDGELWTTACDRTRPVFISFEAKDSNGYTRIERDDARSVEIPAIKKALGLK